MVIICLGFESICTLNSKCSSVPIKIKLQGGNPAYQKRDQNAQNYFNFDMPKTILPWAQNEPELEVNMVRELHANTEYCDESLL